MRAAADGSNVIALLLNLSVMLFLQRSTIAVLAGLIAIASVGCSRLGQIFFNPEPMVRESAQVSCSPQAGQLENFRILGSRDWANGKSVVYQATCRNNSSKPSLAIVGYSMFERHGLNWSPAGGGSAGSPLNASSPQKLAQFVASQSTNQGNRYAAVHGQILSPQVATIEAQFSNGKLLRDDGNGEMFAIVEAGATQVCQVRLLGANGQVLQRHQVGSEAKSSTCPA